MTTFVYVSERCECFQSVPFVSLLVFDFVSVLQVHFRYQNKANFANNTCKCNIFIRIIWLKMTKFQQRLTHNIIDKFTRRMKEIFELAEKEIMLLTDYDTTS